MTIAAASVTTEVASCSSSFTLAPVTMRITSNLCGAAAGLLQQPAWGVQRLTEARRPVKPDAGRCGVVVDQRGSWPALATKERGPGSALGKEHATGQRFRV